MVPPPGPVVVYLVGPRGGVQSQRPDGDRRTTRLGRYGDDLNRPIDIEGFQPVRQVHRSFGGGNGSPVNRQWRRQFRNRNGKGGLPFTIVQFRPEGTDRHSGDDSGYLTQHCTRGLAGHRKQIHCGLRVLETLAAPPPAGIRGLAAAGTPTPGKLGNVGKSGKVGTNEPRSLLGWSGIFGSRRSGIETLPTSTGRAVMPPCPVPVSTSRPEPPVAQFLLQRSHGFRYGRVRHRPESRHRLREG